MKRELLWILPRWPIPAQDGARVASARLLEGLTRRGHIIDALAITGPEEKFDGKIDLEAARAQLGLRDVYQVVTRGSAIRGLAGYARTLAGIAAKPWIPVTLRRFADSATVDAVERVIAGRGEDFAVGARKGSGAPWWGIVYDGLHPAIHRARLGAYVKTGESPRVFYRAHNFETDIWKRKAAQTRNLPFKLFLGFQANAVLRFEKSLAVGATAVAPVGAEDLKLFQALDPRVRGRVVYIGNDFGEKPRPPTQSDGRLEVLFVGKLDWPPNREGLIWFLKNVWPRAQAARPELHLSVVGSGAAEWMGELAKTPGVSFLGRVADLDGVYQQCLISLAPIFYGSGTRVKVIEASRFGRACLSTAIGVEGTGLVPGESYARAETEAEWVDFLRTFSAADSLRIGLAAYHQMMETFDIDRTAGEFERMMDESG